MCYFSFLFLQFCYIDVLYLEQNQPLLTVLRAAASVVQNLKS